MKFTYFFILKRKTGTAADDTYMYFDKSYLHVINPEMFLLRSPQKTTHILTLEVKKARLPMII